MSAKSTSLKEGACPNCGSSKVDSGEGVEDRAGIGGANRIPITAVFSAPLDNFVCIDCGYTESYILDRAVLNRIEREWPKVTPTKS